MFGNKKKPNSSLTFFLTKVVLQCLGNVCIWQVNVCKKFVRSVYCIRHVFDASFIKSFKLELISKVLVLVTYTVKRPEGASKTGDKPFGLEKCQNKQTKSQSLEAQEISART